MTTYVDVDPRRGSKELLAPLRQFGVPARLKELEFADIAFVGRGPDERPITIGIEKKGVREIIGDFDRLAGHQIPGMAECYEQWWVLVEGGVRAGAKGIEIEHGQCRWREPEGRGMSYAEFIRRLLTIEMRAGGRVARTRDRAETIAWLVSFYGWWTAKKWEQHDSCSTVGYVDNRGLPVVSLIRPTKKQLIARILTGPKTSLRVATRFKSVLEMVLATEKEWCEVDGIGKATAREIVELVSKETER